MTYRTAPEKSSVHLAFLLHIGRPVSRSQGPGSSCLEPLTLFLSQPTLLFLTTSGPPGSGTGPILPSLGGERAAFPPLQKEGVTLQSESRDSGRSGG